MSPVLTILAIIFSLAASVLACIFFLSKKWKHAGGFKQWMHEFVNFKTLFVDKIFKFLYIFSTCFVFFLGFFTLFSSAAPYGLLMMFVGPIVLRVMYEMLMMFIIMVTNLTEINRDTSNILGALKNKKGAPITNPNFDNTPAPEAPTATVYCMNCGTAYSADEANCPNCGTPNAGR
jgi:hypothetical protein